MVKEINSTKAYSILRQSGNVVLIDVRSSMEFKYVGHPRDAIHIPLKEPPDWEISINFISKIFNINIINITKNISLILHNIGFK